MKNGRDGASRRCRWPFNPINCLLPFLLFIGQSAYKFKKDVQKYQHLHESQGLGPYDVLLSPPPILHFLWGNPKPTDRGYANKIRVLDNESYTGCCDVMIELALRSYVAHAPNGTDLFFWTMGGWDAAGFLRSIGMDRVVRSIPFDPELELAGDDALKSVYNSLLSVVSRSDFVRYVVMRNYGGSYVDLDAVMVRSIPSDGLPRVNVSPTVVNLTRSGAVLHQTCEGVASAPREPGTCVLSNGMFVNFPRYHIVFSTLLDAIREENRTCGGRNFFCYGPQWVSTTLRLRGNISNVVDVGVRPEVLLRNGKGFNSCDTVLVSHMDFDGGDIRCNDKRVFDLCNQYGMI